MSMASAQPLSLQERIICLPKLAHPKDAAARVGEFLKIANHANEYLNLPQSALELLSALADHSPYLWQLCSADSARLATLFGAAPEVSLEVLLQSMSTFWQEAQTDAEMMRLLRRAKHRSALLIALADLGGGDDFALADVAIVREFDAIFVPGVFIVRES